jgi:hypothetical protein
VQIEDDIDRDRVLALALTISPVCAADPQTSGVKGQPNQDCEAILPGGDLCPPGFNTEGFNFATTRHAGSRLSPNADNPHAVSQYDVACVQQGQRLLKQTGQPLFPRG